MTTIMVFSSSNEPIERSITLTNDEWLILSQCTEAFAETFRNQRSQYIATLLTRGQLSEALGEAAKMNELLQNLDELQVKLL